MEKDELEFIKSWLKVLQTMYPETRGHVNAASIALTGKYISIDARGTVEVAEVERELK